MPHVTIENLRFGSEVAGKRIVTARFTVSAASQMPMDAEIEVDVSFYARDDDPGILAKAREALAHLMVSAATRAADGVLPSGG